MYLRKNNGKRNEISIDEPLNTDWDGNELLLSDVLGTEHDVISKNIEEKDFQFWKKCYTMLKGKQE